MVDGLKISAVMFLKFERIGSAIVSVKARSGNLRIGSIAGRRTTMI